MVYLAAFATVQLAVIAGLVWFCARREDQHAATLLELMQAQDTERAGLLNRIQRPDLLLPPRRPDAPTAPAETPKDLLALRQVGTVKPLRDADSA